MNLKNNSFVTARDCAMSFSHELSVGNRLIDFEHKKLHDLIDEIACNIKAEEVAVLVEAFIDNRINNCQRHGA